LAAKLGGPSVFPPQPAGVTTEGAYGALQWKVGEGPDRYRRGLYTFMKRTTPYAMSSTFDGPSGEVCVPRREVSNTPLQALTLLDDPVFVEAAQALGRRMAFETGSVRVRTAKLYRRCLTHFPGDEELALLVRFYENQRTRFGHGAAVVGTPATVVAEQAAWAALARSLLNVDEMVTKN
jgi:hypothetical protein